jgi:multiple sugar transport system ATP-binding protein
MADVSLRGISVAFQAITVFDQLDLDIERGEFLVLLGPSGCGKSTLLNAIAGLLEVETGQIWIGGRNVTWEEPRDRGIAMVFQSYALYPRMSVRKNMSFGLRMAKTPKDEIERRVAKAAAMLQIEHLLDRRPDQLSGGQRQRVAIGRAMVRDADVFLFDEPLSNLDAQLRNELRVEIKRLHQQLGSTMIYVTHDQIEALTLADRVAVMKDLKIKQLATPHEIYHRPANRFVAGFVGSPRMNFMDGWLEADDQGGWVFTNGTHHLRLHGYPFGRQPALHEEVTLGIRPEHLQLAEDGDWSGFSVEMTEPMGADMLIWVRSGPDLLSVRTSSDQRVAVGSKLALNLPIDRISLFALRDGSRI